MKSRSLRALASAGVALLLIGCTDPTDEVAPAPSPTRKASASTSAAPAPRQTPPTARRTTASAHRTTAPVPSAPSTAAASRASSFAALQRTLSGQAGVAVVPLGGSAAQGFTVGSLQSDKAWSTIKVPIGIAAVAGDDSAVTRRRVTDMITWSDNESARLLFHGLGSPSAAGRKVNSVLRAGGDQGTDVRAMVMQPPVNRFGYTPWTLANSATFAAHLPCMAEAKPVYQLMSQIDDEHHWGLGTIDGARFKGGWGSDGDGYLSRQLGVVTTTDGRQFGVAIMVLSQTSETRANDDLTSIAAWVVQHLDGLPRGRC